MLETEILVVLKHPIQPNANIHANVLIPGLTQSKSGNSVNPTKSQTSLPKAESRNDPIRPRPSEYDTAPTVKRPRPTPAVPRILPQPLAQQDDDIEELVPVVKSEPRDPTPTVMTTPIQPVVQEQSMTMYDDGSQQMQDSMMMTTDTDQYDDNYGGMQYEGQYGDAGYDSSMVAAGHDSSGAGRRKEYAGAGVGGQARQVPGGGRDVVR